MLRTCYWVIDNLYLNKDPTLFQSMITAPVLTQLALDFDICLLEEDLRKVLSNI